MVTKRAIRISTTKNDGPVDVMEFEDSAKGRIEAMKFLEQLKAAHKQHAYFTHPAHKACDKEIKKIENSRKSYSQKKEGIEKAEASRDAELKAAGLVKPKLSVVSEHIEVAEATPAAFDRPARKMSKQNELPEHVIATRGIYFNVDALRKQYGEETIIRQLNALMDPAISKELDLVIEIQEMLK